MRVHVLTYRCGWSVSTNLRLGVHMNVHTSTPLQRISGEDGALHACWNVPKVLNPENGRLAIATSLASPSIR